MLTSHRSKAKGLYGVHVNLDYESMIKISLDNHNNLTKLNAMQNKKQRWRCAEVERRRTACHPTRRGRTAGRVLGRSRGGRVEKQ